jgi:hypothetical protein
LKKEDTEARTAHILSGGHADSAAVSPMEKSETFATLANGLRVMQSLFVFAFYIFF